MPFKVVRKFIERGSERLEEGDIFEPEEYELDAFGDRLEEVGDMAEDAAETFEDATDTAEKFLNPSEYTNDEVEEQVANIDDVGELEEMFEAEESGENRAGAKNAIQDRIDELTE